MKPEVRPEAKPEVRAEGEVKGRLQTAKTMLIKGYLVSDIAEITGLPPKEIKKLK